VTSVTKDEERKSIISNYNKFIDDGVDMKPYIKDNSKYSSFVDIDRITNEDPHDSTKEPGDGRPAELKHSTKDYPLLANSPDADIVLSLNRNEKRKKKQNISIINAQLDNINGVEPSPSRNPDSSHTMEVRKSMNSQKLQSHS